MKNKQEFLLKLKRANLQDSFEIEEQVLPITVVIPPSYFRKIEHYVNTTCGGMDIFSAKCYCSVETYLSVRKHSVEQIHTIVVESIVNYDNIVIANKSVTIDKP